MSFASSICGFAGWCFIAYIFCVNVKFVDMVRWMEGGATALPSDKVTTRKCYAANVSLNAFPLEPRAKCTFLRLFR